MGTSLVTIGAVGTERADQDPTVRDGAQIVAAAAAVGTMVLVGEAARCTGRRRP